MTSKITADTPLQAQKASEAHVRVLSQVESEAPDSRQEIEHLRRRVAELEQLLEEQKRAEAFQEGQRRFFEQLLTGQPIEVVLDTLLRAVETRTNDARCSILLVDESGTRLLHGAAPSLPDDYNQKIHGIAVGPTVGSCGTAVALRRPVIVSDIATDPLWVDFKDLAMSYGLRACWSVPFYGGHDAVRGTFACYYAEPRIPTDAELQQINDIAHLAAIAVEHRHTERALMQSERRIHALVDNAPLTIFALDRRGRFIFASGCRLTHWLPPPSELLGRSALDLVHDHPGVHGDLQRALAGEPVESIREFPDAVIQARYTPIQSSANDATAVIGIAIDVTARERAQAEAKRLQERMIEMQAAAIAELSTPLIPISKQVVVMPLIGTLDPQRANQALTTLLTGVTTTQARCVIVDITGMTTIDTAVADALLRTARAVRLLGAEVILTGMRPETAQAMVDLGVDLSSLVTHRSLQQGIAYAVRTF